MKRAVTLSFLLSVGALSQSALASPAAFPQGMRGTPVLTLVADEDKCWLQRGPSHDSCDRPWGTCLEQVQRKFGAPKFTGGRPQTDGSQPFYDKCDAARTTCEAKYCK